jgi:hypothetical protein
VAWLCPTTCYDHGGMKDAGATMDGELIYSPFLPFEEMKSNEMLANFVKYTGKGRVENVDSFAVFGWSATIAFQEALTTCYVLMRYTGGEFERVHHTKPGTSDCKASNEVTVEASPIG